MLRCSRLKNAERDSDPSSLGLRFHASVPIYAGNVPLGVLNVASEDWRELQAEELQLLHIISDQIGLAVQRARLSAEQTHSATRFATIEERNRLAREIHDTLAQGLAAITLQLETADALAETKPARTQEAIRRALSLARTNLEEARRSVMDLRAAPLQEHTLSEALALLIASQQERSSSTSFTYYPPAYLPTLPTRIEAGLYRIVQEALTNAGIHAQAHSVELYVIMDDTSIHATIQDDGIGFDPDIVMHEQSQQHFGLAGMSERAKLLGGTLHIESTPGAGTRVVVTLPRK